VEKIRHILSVDVEDYFQVEAFARSISRGSWDQWHSRVVANTHRVLDLFDEFSAQATFFFVGWIAQRFPAIVREVHSRGHEVACHSHWHRPVYSLTPDQFRSDTSTARDVIEQVSGERVLGYRAPTWSITKDCLWALDILAEEGFLYDSSIYPIRQDLYGMPGAPRFAYIHSLSNGAKLKEFPPTTLRFAGVNFPAAGGGSLRIFPLFYTRWAFRQFERKYRQPVVVYFHPWELDPSQPRLKGGWRSRFRHYTNLDRMEERVRALLREHRFQSFHDLLVSEEAGTLGLHSEPTDQGEIFLRKTQDGIPR
jgi:polysaccharide deacetylase family protein (PEP-CTERM system associated)